MRDLDWTELKYVSGAGDSPTPPCTCEPTPTPEPTPKTRKGNNGFGNGSDDPNFAAPGGSAGAASGKNFDMNMER